LLSAAETKELRLHREIAIANMPFGYRSAFLFTHNAFEEALRLRYGSSPSIHVLSYMNLDKHNPIAVSGAAQQVSFAVSPNAFRYFRLPNQQIFFAQPDIYPQDNITLRIDQLDSAGRIREYRLLLPAQHPMPIYYFDGERFVRLPPNGE
jgi:hypothetical protein